MEKAKYNLIVFYENGEGYRIIGVKEGKDIYDYISKKHDKVLDPDRGTIEINSSIPLKNYIMVDEYYDITWEEKQEWESQCLKKKR